MKERIRKWIRLLLVLMWAAAFTQGPAFIVQYEDHLSGHVEELNYQLQLLKEMTGSDDLSTYSDKMQGQEQKELQAQGAFVQRLLERRSRLKEALETVSTASPWSMPFVFLFHLDRAITQETLSSFTYTVPATWESLIYGLLGAFVGYGIFKLIGSILRGLRNLFRREKKTS